MGERHSEWKTEYFNGESKLQESLQDILEQKNAAFKMRHSFSGLKNILDTAEDRVGKPEDT